LSWKDQEATRIFSIRLAEYSRSSFEGMSESLPFSLPSSQLANFTSNQPQAQGNYSNLIKHQ